MNSFLKKLIHLLTLSFFCFFIIFSFGCAGSQPNKFQSKIQRMSDNDLLSYYHGINERLKDIDSDIKREESQNQTDQERVLSNMPYFFGGEGHNLIQKRKVVLKELNVRNIIP